MRVWGNDAASEVQGAATLDGPGWRLTRPVLITGCSSGIGLATATHLAARGVPVYATVGTAEDAARVAAIVAYVEGDGTD